MGAINDEENHRDQFQVTETQVDGSRSNTTKTRYCEVCDKNIDVFYGGSKNWDSHIGSKSHKSNQSAKGSKNKKLTSFFTKKPSNLNPSSTPAADCIPPPQLKPVGASSNARDSAVVNVNSESDAEIDIVEVTEKCQVPRLTRSKSIGDSEAADSLVELLRLKSLAESVPLDVPIATEEDVLARFAQDPSEGYSPSGAKPAWDLWESSLHDVLNAIFWGKDDASLSKIVRRGPLGIEAFYKWISTCIDKLGIPYDVLEPRIERMNNALLHV